MTDGDHGDRYARTMKGTMLAVCDCRWCRAAYLWRRMAWAVRKGRGLRRIRPDDVRALRNAVLAETGADADLTLVWRDRCETKAGQR